MKKLIRIVLIAAALTAAYMYFKPAPIDPSLVAETTDVATGDIVTSTGTRSDTNNFSLTSNSVLNWTGRKVGGEHYGTVKLTDGFLAVEEATVTAGEFTIDMTTITANDLEGDQQTKLNEHLASADFFDVAQYPTGRFTITSLTPSTSGTNMYDVIGTLMIKGIGKQIKFPAMITMATNTVTVQAGFYIDRQNRGLTTMDGIIDNNLGINFNLTFSPAL